jgi:hypothetical protein
VATLTRRRGGASSGGPDPQDGTRDYDAEKDERRSSRRSSRTRDEEPDERPSRGRGRSSRDDDDDKPARRRSRSGGDDKPARRRGTGGFASYSQKKRSNSDFADEFKPEANKSTLIKFGDPEPFDVFHQHWVEEGNASGKTRHSFVCRDDEYFGDSEDDRECPLCEIGEPASTYSLFNIIDLTNPRKPETLVWKTSPAVTDKLMRASEDKKTSPLDREDLYFEVTMVKKKNKTEWDIQPVKARDLEEDFDMEPLSEDEIEELLEKRFEDRTAITKVDSYDDLQELADSLD